jgi:hypothetical protein
LLSEGMPFDVSHQALRIHVALPARLPRFFPMSSGLA